MSPTTAVCDGNGYDHEYARFVGRVNARLAANAAKGPLFTTDAAELSAVYLASFVPDRRQYHDCRACKRFIDRYGSLVVIDEDGRTAPAIWHEDDAPPEELAAWKACAAKVRKAKVTGVYLSADPMWGEACSNGWQHLVVANPRPLYSAVLTAGQKMAEKREEHRMAIAALAEFPQSAVDQALTLLRNDQLYRSEKVLGAAEWLRERHLERKAKRNAGNLLWRAVATAPAGFCHVRGGMIGTLLEDIVAGLPFDDVSKRFAAKMHPLQYQRPQALPTVGNVAAAEKVIAQLSAAGSLSRRFAGLDDVTDTLWRAPAPAVENAARGVFGHVKTKDAPAAVQPLSSPPVVLTWAKFVRTVLPTASKIEATVPQAGNFHMLTTATVPASAPVLQWDRLDARNPVAWYVWNGGSSASSVGLAAGQRAVAAVIALPCHWHNNAAPNTAKRPLLLLQGAADDTNPFAGLALFPEFLISDLHSVRATIEQFSRQGKLGPSTSPAAVGLPVVGATVTVTGVDGLISQYKIDRLD